MLLSKSMLWISSFKVDITMLIQHTFHCHYCCQLLLIFVAGV
jgi:hypothetical protein